MSTTTITAVSAPKIGDRIKTTYDSRPQTGRVISIEPTMTAGIDRYWIGNGPDIIAVYLDEIDKVY